MITRTLDACGEICPEPLTLAMKEMQTLVPGDHLKVMVDSPNALETISRWAQQAGHKIVGVREVRAARWEITIEKLAP